LAVRRWPFAVVLVALAVGCGDDSKDESSAQKKGPVPASLRTVESASEDIIDLALAGKRADVVGKARRLQAAAREQQGAELRKRAERVAKLAPSAPLIDVALASNQVFALVPGLFARYDIPVPASVTKLDYLDFEAKLESRAGNDAALSQAVDGLGSTWESLRASVTDAQAARRFDRHVEAMSRLASNSDPQKTQREAQHGLDLVDELEESFDK
jgi:hypothetical protein